VQRENLHQSDPDRLVSHIVEVSRYIEDAYLLSKRQITSFKVEKLQQKFRYGLNKDTQKETQIMIAG